MTNINGIEFQPVKTTSDILAEAAIQAGTVWFVVDTGEIFLDESSDSRVPIGGRGVVLYYGNDEAPEENALNGTYTLKINEDCKTDDLILNADGCFYKIIDMDVDDGIAICSKLTVQGSGGGGSGGSGGETPSQYKEKMSVSITGITPSATVLLGQEQKAFILTKSNIDENDTVLDQEFDIECTILEGSSVVYKTNLTGYHNRTAEWNYGKQLEKVGVSYTIKIAVTGSQTGAICPTYTYRGIKVTTLDISLSDNFNPLLPLQNTNAKLIFNIIGNIEKVLSIYIDDILIGTKNYASNQAGEQEYILPNTLTPGRKRVKAKLAPLGNDSENVPTINFEIAIYTADYTGTIIWFGDYKQSYFDYENIQIPFMIKNFNPENESDTILVYHNQNNIQTIENLIFDNTQWYYLTIPEQNFDVNMENVYELITINTNSSISFYVAKGEIELYKTGLRVLFNPAGRSNSEIKEKRTVWSYINDSNETFNGSFENFNWYTNGWLMDEEKTPILRLTNGAKFSISIFDNSMKTFQQLTFEFCLKISNITKYKKQIKTTVSGDDIADAQNESLIYEYDTTEGVCVSWYDIANKAGLIIGTQQAFFKQNNTDADVRISYIDEEKINLTFTLQPLAKDTQQNRYILSVFLDGLWSGATLISAETPFESRASELIFSSEYADIDLYSFRVYDSGLNFYEIVQNYCYDKKSPELYFQNQITKDEDKYALDLNKILAYNEQANENGWDVIMPYFIVDIISDPDGTPSDDLPAKKGNNKIVRFDFYNTILDNAYRSSQLKSKIMAKYDPLTIFKGEDTTEEAYYLHHCPSFISIGGDLNVQGTSSQFYPRKNYKLKNKKATSYINGGPQLQALADRLKVNVNDLTLQDYENAPEVAINKSAIYLDNTKYATNKFCFKVDYMESSGSYNTGFANLIGGLNLPHPLSKYGFENTKGMRTTVYGFPVLGFQRKDDGSLEYIGRYNFNLDKSSNEYFGFESKDPHPYVSGKTIADIAECWEFRDNQGFFCSFKDPNPEIDSFYEITDSEENSEKGLPYSWEHFEYRYVRSFNADTIDDLLEGKTVENAEGFNFSTPDGRRQYFNSTLKNFEKLWRWVNSTDKDAVKTEEEILNNPELQDLYRLDSRAYNRYDYDCKEYREEKFRREFELHLDKEYCLTYFVLTELLLCFDSRGKNMMMASFGPKTENGEYIWFPIFYDVDTQLGLNNSGALLWDYSEDAFLNGTYSTNNSVLWKNLYDCFYADLAAKYSEIREKLTSADVIEGWYSCNPNVTGSPAMVGARPLVALNLDEYFKYVAIINTPYLESPGVYNVDSTGAYLRDLQGNRMLARKLLIRNRMYYEDSFWQKGVFDGSLTNATGMAEFRFLINYPNLSSDKWIVRDNKIINVLTNEEILETDSEYVDYQHLNASNEITITPFLDCYISFACDNKTTTKTKTLAGQPITLMIPENMLNTKDALIEDQINKFLGVNYLSSIGPIYKQYAHRAALGAATRLRELLFGNGYRGTKYSWENSHTTNMIFPEKMPILETFDITNYRGWTGTIDLKTSQKLKTLKAIGSGVSIILLAEGLPITTLQLPRQISRLEMIHFNNLTQMQTSQVLYGEDTDPPGLYIQYLTDEVIPENVEKNSLSTLIIKNDSLGVQSYWLTKNAIDRKGTQDLSIELENINWSPYELVEYGSEYHTNKNYYYDNLHNQLENYQYNENTWQNYTLNERLYTLRDNQNLYNIRPIESTETLIDWLTISNNVSFVDISGICYIDNIENIDETAIAAIEQRWPDLKVFARNVNKQYQMRFIRDDGEKEEILYFEKANTPQNFTFIDSITFGQKLNKEHYDFIGWKLLLNNVIYTSSTWNNIPWDSNEYDYIFIAQYQKTYYNITFIIDGDDISQTQIFNIQYNDNILLPEIVPCKNDSELETFELYQFKGYSDNPNSTTPIDFTNQKAYINKIYYPIFEIIDISNISDTELEQKINYELFNFETISYNDGEVSANGYSCKLKNPTATKGKIILPSKYNGTDIIAIAGFSNSNVTHIFVLNNNNLKTVSENCFYLCSDLVYFPFHKCNSLRIVATNSFRGTNLNIGATGLGNSLYKIETFAFNRAFNSNNQQGVLQIPSSVVQINGAGFAFNNDLKEHGWIINIGSPDNPSQLDLSKTAISYTGNYFQVICENDGGSYQSLNFYTNKYGSPSEEIVLANQDRHTLSEFFAEHSTGNPITSNINII